MEQQLSYCTTSDGVRVAYATYGNEQAPPLVYGTDIPNQEATWASPWGRAFIETLATRRRVITYDGRGYGSSQRDADIASPNGLPADVGAVVDHLGLDRFELLAGGSYPCVRSIAYAGEHPERVSKLVLYHPRAVSSPTVIALAEMARASFPVFIRSLSTIYFPSGPPEVQRWFSNAVRSSVSAETFEQALRWTFDLSSTLSSLEMPVLILHRTRAQTVNPSEIRQVAALIPHGRLVRLDGDSGALYVGFEGLLDPLYEFLGIGGEGMTASASGTAVILFTDIADSTGMTERIGDAAFRELARSLDAVVRAAVREHGGQPVDGKVLGDGVMGVFTSAAQAIAAARACVALGAALPMHLGIHAGDVISEDGNVYGGAVNIASRICGLSEPGEILVSQTVRDLARTSAGVVFEDRGEHALKGVEDRLRLFIVRERA